MSLSDYIFIFLQVTIPLALVLHVYFRWTFQYWARKGVPYLEPKPFIGNLTDMVGDEVTGFYNIAKPKGWKYCGLYLFTKPALLIIDLELIRNIVTTNFNNFVDRGVFVNEKIEKMGAHLFNAGGTRWRNLRLKFSPHFSTARMKTVFEIQVKCGKTMDNYLREKLDLSKPVDIKSILSCFTLDVIGSSAFGIECNNFKQLETSPFRKYGHLTFMNTPWIKLKTSISRVFPKLAEMLRFTLIREDVKEFFHNLVVDTVKYREENKIERNDFLQMMIDLKNQRGEHLNEYVGDGKNLTMDEMIAQCFLFFNAGYETSSTTMTFCLYELSVNQDIQDKVRAEIFDLLKKHKEITYEALKELKYMDQVIAEEMRKYPALAFITRVCVKDYQIPDSDIIIEKGTEILIPMKGIHHDAEYHKDPQKFDPDRFLSERVQERHPYTFFPFGEGPRTCIGARLGLMATKMGLFTILKNFRVRFSDKTRTPFEFSKNTVVPTVLGGIWLKLEKL